MGTSHNLRRVFSFTRAQAYGLRSCLTSRMHPFDFININKHSRLINSNLLQRSKISVVGDNKVPSQEDNTSKRAHVQ